MAMNTCVLMGRLTRDPEKRYTANNTPVTSFAIAVDRFKEGTDFFDITAWRETWRVCLQVVFQGRHDLRPRANPEPRLDGQERQRPPVNRNHC